MSVIDPYPEYSQSVHLNATGNEAITEMIYTVLGNWKTDVGEFIILGIAPIIYGCSLDAQNYCLTLLPNLLYRIASKGSVSCLQPPQLRQACLYRFTV
jgi:hypothetical protein